MFSDSPLVLHLLSLMKAQNVRRVVISPGSRHYPVIRSLENDPAFELYSVVDERSAAFFALGLIQRTGEPAAVMCTSGTAVTNYSSAVVEAHYQGLPLLVLTADRTPEFLDQLEDQMFKQDDVYRNFIAFEGQLKEMRTDLETWYSNRVINEALLALTADGGGPVHLNFPVANHHADTFSTPRVPDVRVMSRVIPGDADDQRWSGFAERLRGKRVLVLWGQSASPSADLMSALNTFLDGFDSAVFADHLSNLHHPARITNAYPLLRSVSPSDHDTLAPDVVISMFGNVVFNEEVKRLLRAHEGRFEHWRVSPDGSVVDPYRRLTTIFKMRPEEFFKRICAEAGEPHGADAYRRGLVELSRSIPEPRVAYSELAAIGEFMSELPAGAALHIGNSMPMRMSQVYALDPSIQVFANRGINGIDGCMSAAVGSAASSDQLTFLVIGDLSFFYDMNSLWIRHVSKNLRILLINNEGGAVMHQPLSAKLGPTLGEHVSAQHDGTAEAWVRSRGFTYVGARDTDELRVGVAALCDASSESPVILEVFTNRLDDVAIMKDYISSIKRMTVKGRVRERAKRAKSKIGRALSAG